MNERQAIATGALRRRDLICAGLGSVMATAGFAQTDKIEGPLKIVLPFGPGSGTDIYARIVAQRLSAALKVPAVVENKPGANGILAAEAVARAKPDGNTLLFTTNTTHAANPHLVKRLSYDPVKDFAPISKMGNLTFFVLVPATSPFRTLAELVQAARKKPGTVTYGAPHSFATVSGSKLGKDAGVEFLRVPYKSSPEITTALLGSQIDFGFIDMAAAAALMKSGRVRPLAVLSNRRYPSLPDVPTMTEAGYPGFNVVAWFGLFAPAGTPQPIVNRINHELVAVLNQADLREKGAELGIDVFSSSPQELSEYVKSQIALWAQLTADAGLKAE